MMEIFVTRSSMPSFDEYCEEIRPLWNSHYLTNMGPKHEELRGLLRDYLDVDNIDLLVNGHMALELSIQALNLQGEVITTPFTFASTTHAIVRNGITPVFCDINPSDFTIDVEKIESLVTDRTSAIIPVHVYGNVCDVEAIEWIAKKYGLKVVYDAAHTFGEKYKGKGVGNFGDVSCYSFHATKVYNTIEGGAVCYSDKLKDFGRTIYQLKNFGIKNEEVVDGVGANAKMNEFSAAMGICNIRHIAEDIDKRRIIAERYREILEDVDGINLSNIAKDVESNYAYFPIVVDEKTFGFSRNEIHDELAKRGISARKYFYPLTSSFDCFHNKYDINNTPIALHISRRVLTLPIYPELSLDDVDTICDVIRSMKPQKNHFINGRMSG